MASSFNDHILDRSIGSDGERSPCASNDGEHSPADTPTAELTVLVTGDETGAEFAAETTPLRGKFCAAASRNTLKFSIENILRADFGRGVKSSSESSNDELSTPSPGSSTLTSPTTPGSEPATTPGLLWPAWVYCTRYSDRPSSGPRKRKVKAEEEVKRSKPTEKKEKKQVSSSSSDDKRPRTAFTAEQLARLKTEFNENRYLTEKRRLKLSRDLDLNESQIKIWFQNKRAKQKKQCPGRNVLALHLMAQGLYNHATVSTVSRRGSVSSSNADD